MNPIPRSAVKRYQASRNSQGTRKVATGKPSTAKPTDEVILSKCNERSAALLSSIRNLRQEGFATDFQVRVKGRILPVHRLVLAASSNYFKAMLSHNMQESIRGFVEIKGLDGNAVKVCIDYLYSGKIHFKNFADTERVLEASNFLQFDELKSYLFQLLLSKLNQRTCLLILKYANTYNSPVVSQSCEKYIGKCLTQVAASNAWNELSATEVTRYIGIPTDRNTANLWPAVIKWVDHEPLTRAKHLIEYLRLISPLNPQMTITHILPHARITEQSECVQFIMTGTIESKCPGLVDVGNWYALYCLADQHKSTILAAAVRDFMVRCLQNVVSRRGPIHNLTDTDISYIFKKAQNCSDTAKFEAISSWAGREESRNDVFVHLFKLLDLTKVPADFIHTTIRNNRIVSSSIECSNLVVDALIEHVNKPPGSTLRGLQYRFM